ncbi:MAG: rRNA maturation RNase YbeY [Burkholderiales bacterium]|nr:rRNA maturation RNase YbeY [Burkholderiales bacterium]
MVGKPVRNSPADACATKNCATKPTLKLAIQYVLPANELPIRSQFRRWVRAALERDAEITLRVVDEAEGRALNRQYRGKDYATNVLSFAYGAPAPGLPLLADIVLCAPVLAREAKEQGKLLFDHYAHLTIHGVLHVQSYDHGNAKQAEIMEVREVEILSQLGVSNPY